MDFVHDVYVERNGYLFFFHSTRRNGSINNIPTDQIEHERLVLKIYNVYSFSKSQHSCFFNEFGCSTRKKNILLVYSYTPLQVSRLFRDRHTYVFYIFTIYTLLYLHLDPTQVYNINVYINISKYQQRIKILFRNDAIQYSNHLEWVGHKELILEFFKTSYHTFNHFKLFMCKYMR